MSKTFETKAKFDEWMINFKKSYMETMGDNLFNQLMAPELTAEDYISGLLSDGYTDLDNLVVSGEPYEIGGYTNAKEAQ